jgi:Outer membrane protein beta-barrel domain
MKKLFTVSFVLILTTAILCAQSTSDNSSSKYTLGILGGLNIPQLSGGNSNELSRDYTSRLGEAFGIVFSRSLGSKFSLQAEAIFSSEGGKRNGIQAIDASSFNPSAPAGTYLYADFKNESILNYFEIPVLAKYSFSSGSSSKFYINFGPYVGFLLNAKEKTSGTSLIYMDRAETMPLELPAQSFTSSVSTTSSINPVNFGLTGGAGFSHSLGSGELSLDVRGAYGLTVVQKNSQDGSNHTGCLLIALIYAIPL